MFQGNQFVPDTAATLQALPDDSSSSATEYLPPVLAQQCLDDSSGSEWSVEDEDGDGDDGDDLDLDNDGDERTSGNRIVSLSCLQSLIAKSCVCSSCTVGVLTLEETTRSGLVPTCM